MPHSTHVRLGLEQSFPWQQAIRNFFVLIRRSWAFGIQLSSICWSQWSKSGCDLIYGCGDNWSQSRTFYGWRSKFVFSVTVAVKALACHCQLYTRAGDDRREHSQSWPWQTLSWPWQWPCCRWQNKALSRTRDRLVEISDKILEFGKNYFWQLLHHTKINFYFYITIFSRFLLTFLLPSNLQSCIILSRKLSGCFELSWLMSLVVRMTRYYNIPRFASLG